MSPAETPEERRARDHERELVDQVRDGDSEAFASLVDLYSEQAFAVAYGFLQHVEDAEDLVQDAFIRALERIDRLKPGSPFGPWFYRLVVNASLNRRRYRARRRTEPIPPNARGKGNPVGAAHRAEMRERLARALRALPEVLETVVVLHDLEGFTHPEIAEMLDIPVGTSRSHLFRARRKLRSQLREYETHLP